MYPKTKDLKDPKYRQEPKDAKAPKDQKTPMIQNRKAKNWKSPTIYDIISIKYVKNYTVIQFYRG